MDPRMECTLLLLAPSPAGAADGAPARSRALPGAAARSETKECMCNRSWDMANVASEKSGRVWHEIRRKFGVRRVLSVRRFTV